MSDLVSIITPCYNAASYIEETVNSVKAQTHTHWELFLVDDCSTDNTVEVIEKLAASDKRIKVLKNSKNQGQALTRNETLDLTKGEYIAFLDSDDLWEPNKIKQQIDLLVNQNAELCYTAYQRCNQDNSIKGRIISCPETIKYTELLKGNVICCSSVLAHNKVKHLLKSDFPHRDDFVRWLNVLKEGHKAVGINQPLVTYRIHTESVSANKWKSARRTWRLFRQNQKLNLPSAAFYFTHYAINGIIKHSSF